MKEFVRIESGWSSEISRRTDQPVKVVIQKVDMDTALTAFLLGVAASDEIVAVVEQASREDLADPEFLCIEAGGSGRVDLNNFDHHNSTLALPPACCQALEASGQEDPALRRLVDYVAAIDVARLGSLRPSPGFPTLSDVFSGMRLHFRKDPRLQFRAGLAIFRAVRDELLDPFGLMPSWSGWRPYLEARQRENKEIERVRANAEVFLSRSGRLIGFLQTDFIGAPGALYGLGCEVAIAYSPRFLPPAGGDPVPRFTIAGNLLRVDHLLPHLNALEPGWGGPSHGTIIASPRRGSGLLPGQVRFVVWKHV